MNTYVDVVDMQVYACYSPTSISFVFFLGAMGPVKQQLGDHVLHIQLATTIQQAYVDDSEHMEPDHIQQLLSLMTIRKME
jgi:hypothetical protein